MSSGFVSEKELAEARQKRQEEWEKVRTNDQPLEAPEEPYDSRSLFERLEEQRKKRDLEYEESRKLKNMIKGLDDDEIDFLDLVDQKKLEAEKNKTLDEERELLDYRNRVANLQEKSLEERLHAEIKNIVKPKQIANNSSNRLSQNKLLKGIVLKKSDAVKSQESCNDLKLNSNHVQNEEKNKNVKSDHLSENSELKKSIQDNENDSINKKTSQSSLKRKYTEDTIPTCKTPPLKCIAILPGLGNYAKSSSDSDSGSSDTEQAIYSKTKFDLLGRKIKEKLKDD